MNKKIDKIFEIIKSNKSWIIFFISAVLFCVILEDIFDNEIWKFDMEIYNAISKLKSNTVTNILKVITNLGGPICIITIAILSYLMVKNKKYKNYILINLIIVTIVNQALKFIIQRPRPTEYRIIEQAGYSFPSRTFYGKYGILWLIYIFNL